MLPYTGPDADRLTVGGELDKVAANIAIGRTMAGVHWRTDYSEAVRLGETVAIGVLRDHARVGHESASFGPTRFDGSRMTIRANHPGGKPRGSHRAGPCSVVVR